ncbi:hypothetical protein [Candidatus Igneacidithiobacillus taiwanensis]|nr:hypothetical protein [Candidatus Igneacidithiobacillus taiwanensis]MCE5360120.1 hypothetical protein [Acidithiobacillus sp.]
MPECNPSSISFKTPGASFGGWGKAARDAGEVAEDGGRLAVDLAEHGLRR